MIPFKKTFAWLLPALLMVEAACVTDFNRSRKKAATEGFRVVRVVDGDTFVVDDGSETHKRVRLIGVDAPELRKGGDKEAGYYAVEAKAYLASLLKGQYVKLVFDVGKTDRYRRLLAYVYLNDGTFVNAQLVKNGYAMVMTVPPNVKNADLFAELQEEARNENRGLWAAEAR